MRPNLDTVYNEALRLPYAERLLLIDRLKKADTPVRRKTGDVTRFFGTFKSGDPNSADNERIDADLAEEYSDDHKPEN